MLGFDLSQFRDIAFGRASVPDHPLHDEKAVRKMVDDLPADPLAGLAEVTHWVLSINADDSFEPEQRGRVLAALDAAAQPYWSELSMQYLAPNGTPAEGQDGEPAILRALVDSAFEFATGYGYCLQADGPAARWIDKNLAQLALQRMGWLARRFTLANMLHSPNIDGIWEDLHLLYSLAEAREVLRKVIPVDRHKSRTSSVKQEYTRLLLVDMAGLETLRGRDVELAFRIAGRVAANARLEPDPIPGAICAIELLGSARPVAVRHLHESGRPMLYLDAFNCLPRLKVMLERDMGADLDGPDAMFGAGYTLRERNGMINRLIDLWGPTPPQRRSKRVSFKGMVLLKGGFASSTGVVRPLEQGSWEQPGNAAQRMQIVLDDAGMAMRADGLKRSLADTTVQLVDASVTGLGLLVPRKEAAWARLGMLVAVYVEPGPDWVVGAVRRISSDNGSLRLGVAIFSRQPKLVWFRLETTGYASVWEQELRAERNFLEHFQCGVLFDVDRLPLGPGELLLAPGIADRGSRLEIPFSLGVQRVRITAVRETTGDFHRVAFESMGVTQYGTDKK